MQSKADLKNYLALIHHGQDSEHLRQNLVKPSENNLGGFSNEDSNNLNSVGDDRIPFDINGRKLEAKEVGHDTQISYENLALEVVKDVLLNHPNAQFDFQECLNAMANIVEEERLVRTIKNLTMDAVSIISNASAMIVECQEKNSFSTCLVTAVNELGAAFIGVSEDIERAVMATMVLTQKLYEQIKLCIGQNDLPISAIVTSLLRMTHASDSTHLKDNASNEIPRVPQEPSESQAHKWYPFLREHRQFNNL